MMLDVDFESALGVGVDVVVGSMRIVLGSTWMLIEASHERSTQARRERSINLDSA